MTPGLAEYIESGKSLGVDDRLEAARQLLLSVDHDEDVEQSQVDAEWDEVVARRVNEITSGEVRPVDGRSAHARVRAELAARRK